MKSIYYLTITLMASLTTFLQQNVYSAEVRENPLRVSVANVAPALLGYNLKYIHNGLWERSQLSKRDRSLVTIAALITRNDTTELPFYVELALDNGVKPAEISEIITHLAFYAGHANAYSAIVAIEPIFKKRNIKPQSLPQYDLEHLPLDEATEKARATQVAQNFEAVAPGVLQFTTDALFKDLWLRPDLKPRDRSLITVSALITSGQAAHIPYHLNKAMDNGLTQSQASEVPTQLAFYAGWPNSFSAMPYFKSVFESRQAY